MLWKVLGFEVFSSKIYYYPYCPFCSHSSVSTIEGTIKDEKTYVHNCLHCGRWWPNPIMDKEEFLTTKEEDDAKSNF